MRTDEGRRTTRGPDGPSFEGTLETTYSGRTVVYTNKARCAFELVLEAENLHGARVLFPAFMCADTFVPILDRYDIEPVFVDIEPGTYHAEVEDPYETLATVDAALVHHTFGLPMALDQWVAAADDADTVLIEDCARALGATVDGRPVGSFGDYAIFSLNKVIPPLLRGGFLVTNRELEPTLREPSLDPIALYTLLPNQLRRPVSFLYNAVSSGSVGSGGTEYVEPTALDYPSRARLGLYMRSRFGNAVATELQTSRTFRERLAPLGFDFQSDGTGRVHHTLPALVPTDRDALARRLSDLNVHVGVQWTDVLASRYESDWDVRYPVTNRLTNRILHFKPMKYENANETVDSVVTAIE